MKTRRPGCTLLFLWREDLLGLRGNGLSLPQERPGLLGRTLPSSVVDRTVHPGEPGRLDGELTHADGCASNDLAETFDGFPHSRCNPRRFVVRDLLEVRTRERHLFGGAVLGALLGGCGVVWSCKFLEG
jgi:hypothetical protein